MTEDGTENYLAPKPKQTIRRMYQTKSLSLIELAIGDSRCQVCSFHHLRGKLFACQLSFIFFRWESRNLGLLRSIWSCRDTSVDVGAAASPGSRIPLSKHRSLVRNVETLYLLRFPSLQPFSCRVCDSEYCHWRTSLWRLPSAFTIVLSCQPFIGYTVSVWCSRWSFIPHVLLTW